MSKNFNSYHQPQPNETKISLTLGISAMATYGAVLEFAAGLTESHTEPTRHLAKLAIEHGANGHYTVAGLLAGVTILGGFLANSLAKERTVVVGAITAPNFESSNINPRGASS